MPCHFAGAGLGDFAGRVRFLRRFGYPGRIDDYERVWLTFAGASDAAEVCLNGHALGRPAKPAEPFEWEITPLLQARNLLAVEVEASGGHGGLWGEVALEVRCTAWLRGVSAWAEEAPEETRFLRETGFLTPGARLHLSGEVVGTAERPLELYALLDNATVAYSVVDAAPGGQPFRLAGDRPLTPGGHAVRVELVNGASVWYVWEQALTVGNRG